MATHRNAPWGSVIAFGLPSGLLLIIGSLGDLPRDVFGGAAVDVHLCDEHMTTITVVNGR
jgi:hypothetical protein